MLQVGYPSSDSVKFKMLAVIVKPKLIIPSINKRQASTCEQVYSQLLRCLFRPYVLNISKKVILGATNMINVPPMQPTKSQIVLISFTNSAPKTTIMCEIKESEKKMASSIQSASTCGKNLLASETKEIVTELTDSFRGLSF